MKAKDDPTAKLYCLIIRSNPGLRELVFYLKDPADARRAGKWAQELTPAMDAVRLLAPEDLVGSRIQVNI